MPTGRMLEHEDGEKFFFFSARNYTLIMLRVAYALSLGILLFEV